VRSDKIYWQNSFVLRKNKRREKDRRYEPDEIG
jgi:hypothetical protein